MTPTATTKALQEVLLQFGAISNTLVYVTEELPSLNLSKNLEDHIVAFSCDFLEFLAAQDTRLRNLLTSLQSAPSHGTSPAEGTGILEEVRQQLWEHIEQMHLLIMTVRSRAAEQPSVTLLEVLLNESGATILKAFLAIREILDPLLREQKPSRNSS